MNIMWNKPKVSVIMPVYNREEVLSCAIESVLNQDYAKFELIIVDDCSTDGTPELISNYEKMDKRIRSVRNEMNSRLAPQEWEPRNDGLRLAQGEYVAYLDSDNEWWPSFIGDMSKVLEMNPEIQLVHCNSLNFYPPQVLQRVMASDQRKLVYCGNDCACFSCEELTESEFGAAVYIDTNEMMHRASVFREIGGYWNTFHPRRKEIQAYQGNRYLYRRHNDQDLFERIYYRYSRQSIYHLNKMLVNYYYPGSNRTRQPQWFEHI